MDAPVMRVLTLNLWRRGGSWPNRRRALVQGLRELNPDLVAFQESVNSNSYDQAADLLDPGYHIVQQSVGLVADGTSSGATIATRWDVEEVRELDLHVTERTADYSCVTMAARINAPEPFGPLLFVDHAPSWQLGVEYERELQAEAAAGFVEEFARPGGVRHVIVAGDFNATPDASSMLFWRGRRALGRTSVCYQDAWESVHETRPGYTFTHRNPLVPPDTPQDFGRRIDYILVRCDDNGPTLRVRACGLAFDKPLPSGWASDHFAVVADFAMRDVKP